MATHQLYQDIYSLKDGGSAFPGRIAGSSHSDQSIPQEFLEWRTRIEKPTPPKEGSYNSWPTKCIPPTEHLIDALDTPVLSRRYAYRGWGLLTSFDKNFEGHFQYDVRYLEDLITDDLENIVLGGQVRNDIPGIKAIVKVNGRHMEANISECQYTSHGLALVELPWTDPVQTAWLAPPYFNISTLQWTDRPSSYATGRNNRTMGIALQTYRINPGQELSYWDLADDLKESPVLVEPTHFSLMLANKKMDE